LNTDGDEADVTSLESAGSRVLCIMAVEQLYIGSTRVKLNSAYNAETVAQQYTWFILVVAGRVVLVGEQERLTNGRHVGHVTTSATGRRRQLDEVRSTKGGATDTLGAADEGGATDTRGPVVVG